MIVLVCGSRDWADEPAIRRRLVRLAFDVRERGGCCTIIHGAASKGRDGVEVSADMLADRIATEHRFQVRRFPADWEREPRRGGILRNLQMLDEHPDLVLAFQRDGSRGTQHTIDEARRRGIPVEVHTA